MAKSEPSARRRGESFPWGYLITFLLGTAIVAGFMWFHIQSERRVSIDHWRAKAETLAEARTRVLTTWLDARRADAEVLATVPSIKALLVGAGGEGGSQSESEGVPLAHLERVAAAYGYKSVLVLSPQGRVLARSGNVGRLNPEALEAARTAARSRRFRVDFDSEASEQRLVSFSVPVFAGDEKPAAPAQRPAVGVVMLRMDPAKGLFPQLSEETSTRTGETLLFSYGVGDASYLSPLRHNPGGWAAQRRSLEVLSALAARAALGQQHTFVELSDYREASAFGVVRWIAPTGWGLVLKMDREEALKEFYIAGRMAGIAASLLIVAFAGVLFSFWRHKQRADLLKEQMKHERAIYSLTSYAEKIVAGVPSGLLVLSSDLRVLSANRSFLESFSLREEGVLGRPLQDVIQGPGLLQRTGEVLRSGIPQHDMLFDLNVGTRPETRPVRITITGIQLAEQDEGSLLLIIQDLTEEERLHAARRASEQRFHDLVQELDAIVWEADAATLRFSFVSQPAERILGYPMERWLRERDFWKTRIHPDDRERIMTTCREATTAGSDHEFEYRAVTADGSVLWLRDIVHVLQDETGRARQLRGLTLDLTERKRAEEALQQSEDQLRQAQKMEAVGQLAGGIAHDFNNLLMVIRGDSDLMLRRLPEGNALRRSAEGIRDAADQAATLTRQLLAFSRKQVLAPKVLDLNEIVAGMHKMLQRLLGETINLVTVPGEQLARVKADPGQIEQVIMNLAVNARDAMPDGGSLTIETSNVGFDDTAVRLHGGGTPGRYVVLAVTDTGSGMDAETQSRLFEPFFTTKEQGKGTGLGLSTVYGIVQQSGGHIWVYSEVGQGTTFKICLPQVEEPAEAPETQEPAAQAARGAETVLLVEDAQRVREVVREILEMNGYEVLEAKHGADAIEIGQAHPGPIHLLVTDVVMPQMSGREVAQRLAPIRGTMKVLYMSGYTDDAIVRHGVLEEGVPFLSKPFTPDALAVKVREVLDGAQPGRQQDRRPPAKSAAVGNGGGPSRGRAGGPASSRATVAAQQ